MLASELSHALVFQIVVHPLFWEPGCRQVEGMNVRSCWSLPPFQMYISTGAQRFSDYTIGDAAGV